MGRVHGLLALAIGLTGCLGAEDLAAPANTSASPTIPANVSPNLTAPSNGTSSPPAAPAPWSFGFEAACTDATIGFLQERARLQSLLPDGFVAADARDFLRTGASLATGQGLIAITTVDCRTSTLEPGRSGEAEIAILVEAPRLDGAEVEPADVHTYFAAVVVSSPGYHARLARFGHDILLAAVTNEVADPPHSGPMRITVADEAGTMLDFTALLPAATSTPEESAHNWQAVPEGVLFSRIDLAARTFGAGTPVACAIREGSLAHDWFGFTRCEGQPALAFGAPEAPYTTTWRFLPGATAGP